MNRFKAVILDIDGTLSPEVSWHALTQGLGASSANHTRIYDAYKIGDITYIDAKKKLLTLWQSTGNANKQYIDNLFTNWKLFDDAEKTIYDIRQEDYGLCIITGSFDIWASVVAKRVGILDWYANTKIIFDERGNLIDMQYDLEQGVKKLAQLKDYCSRQRLKPEQCVVVGDSENDIELFNFTGNGVAVGKNADPELAKVAWMRVSRFADIKSILID